MAGPAGLAEPPRVTVTAVICLALDLFPNVKNPSHWWDLRIGSMPLAKRGVLSKHDSSCAHRNLVISWKQYKVNSYHKTSISD